MKRSSADTQRAFTFAVLPFSALGAEVTLQQAALTERLFTHFPSSLVMHCYEFLRLGCFQLWQNEAGAKEAPLLLNGSAVWPC